MNVQRVEGLPFQKLGEQVLVVVPKTREVHLLNETASRLWDLLERPSTVPALLDTLSAEYELDAGAEADLKEILAEMAAKGLIA